MKKKWENGVIILKANVNKKRLVIFFTAIFIILITVKICSSYIFYKRSFNAAIYDNLARIEGNSESISYFADELLKGNVTIMNISELRWNYDEVFQYLQKLNSNTLRISQNYNINQGSYYNSNIPMIYLKIEDLEKGQKLNLTQEEINALMDTKEIFKVLEEVISENIDDVDRNAWGVPNVLEEDLWLNIIKEIQVKVK